MKQLASTKRNYGIDLLRMVSMFLIVILHTLGHGGLLNALEVNSLSYHLAWILETAAYCAVNCYAMISGYVGWRGRLKISNLLILWIQVAFYCLIFKLAESWCAGAPITLDLILEGLTPVSGNAYWYFTAYCGMFFFAPLVNAAVAHLPRQQFLLATAGLLVLFSVYPTLDHTDIFETGWGYHALWLLTIYAVGAYLGKYQPLQNWSAAGCLGLYWGMILVSWGWLALNNAYPELSDVRLIRYTSPTIVLEALALLGLFTKIPVTGWLQKLVILFSTQSFGVYLIHDNLFVRKQFIKGKLAPLAAEAPFVMLGKVLLFVLAVYVICMLLDTLRHYLFRMLGLKNGLDKLEKKLFSEQ